MKRCLIDLSVACTLKIKLDEGMEEDIEEIMESLEEGSPPVWLQTLVIESLMRELSVDGWEIVGSEPEPDEELNFEE